ncbi:MAG TPA: hypothetical protein VFE05_14485 [Longimicrobiaceae bacterium]|jgi:hypothetical protein|nr:hypothetical protein [Longimicrobiaceae bacterium]
MYGNSSNRISPASVHISRDDHPDWLTGADRLPSVGEEVICTEGSGEVVKVFGKTGDGSRLLELRLPDPRSKPFFAAASNVLVRPGM